MPEIKNNEKYWSEAIEANLKKVKEQSFIPVVKNAHLNPIDAIYHQLISMSEKLDRLGLEKSSALLLVLAEEIEEEGKGEIIDLEKEVEK